MGRFRAALGFGVGVWGVRCLDWFDWESESDAMFLPPGLCPKVGRVDGVDAEVHFADSFGRRSGEHGVGCELGCEVECADEVGGVLGVGEEGDGSASAVGWHGGVRCGGFGEHDGRLEFILWD